MTLRERLSGRINKPDIAEYVMRMQENEGISVVNELYDLLIDADKRISDNAAWILSHAKGRAERFLNAKQGELISEALATTSNTKRRLLLSILKRQSFDKQNLRTDFFDFCLSCIVDNSVPIGIRALCLYLSFTQCQHYPELLMELELTIDILDNEDLSAGLKCAKRSVRSQIRKNKV